MCNKEYRDYAMKQLFCMLLLLCCLASCDPWVYFDYCAGIYYVRNMSDRELSVNYSHAYGEADVSISAGECVEVFRAENLRYLGYPSFRTFLKAVDDSQETEKSLTVVVNGKEVRKWFLSEKDGPGRQFFDESRWEHTVDYDGNMPDTFKWVFDILPEDIGMPVENGSEKF